MNKNQKLRKIIDYGGEEVEVTRITNVLYRVGYCSRCGACCKNIDINSRVSEYVIEWLKGYGVTVQIKDNIFESPDERSKYEYSATLSFPITCKHLVDEPITEQRPESVYTCTIHKERPAICKLYPRKSSKWATCTFVFLDDNDLNWFIKEWEKKHGKEKKIKFIS